MLKRELVKVLLLISIFLSGSIKLFAVQIDSVHIYADSLKKHSTNLSLPWKYHPGDNMEWASPNFDDSDWDTLRTIMKYRTKDYDNWKGIGWFRRVIVIDSALIDKSIAFSMQQYGASQIYLNGKLVHEFGKVGTSAEDEEVYQPRRIPITLELDSNTVYVLAVRYSNFNILSNKGWYGKWLGYAGFVVNLAETNDAFASRIQNEGLAQAVNMGIAGIFLSLAFLYFLLFFFYSMKKENLYYSLFTLLIAVTFASGMLRRFIHTDISLQIYLSILSSLAIIWVFAAYLAFLYSIFYKQIPKQFWIFIIFAVILSIIMVFVNLPEDFSMIGYFAFMLLATIEGLRTIIVAIKRKKEHSWVIGAGVIVFFLFIFTLFILGLLGMGNINSLIGVILFFIGLLSLPLSMSIYLARDIASTNKKLIKQLETVKELSKKELEQKLRAQKAEAENERKTKELEEARQLQLSMLPKELPQLPHIDIAVYMQTATEVGGDYYDFHVDMDGTLTTVIGDATGHGLKAGTMVTAVKSLFNTYATNSNIIETFHEISRVLKGMKMHLLSMCLTIAKIKDHELEVSSAGMPYALLYRKETGSVEELVLKGMPLGAANDFPYQVKKTKLKRGDTLLLLSDGFPELFNSNMEIFGYERVTEEFGKVAAKTPGEIIESLKQSGAEWKDHAAPDDDVTFVVLKIKN